MLVEDRRSFRSELAGGVSWIQELVRKIKQTNTAVHSTVSSSAFLSVVPFRIHFDRAFVMESSRLNHSSSDMC